MSNNESTAAVDSDKNYSEDQVKFLIDNAPWNLEKARAFEGELEHGWRSIVAKVKNLDIQYDSKPPPVKKPHKVTKAELVAMLAKRLDRDLTGLEKATAAAINAVINGVQHIMAESVD